MGIDGRDSSQTVWVGQLVTYDFKTDRGSTPQKTHKNPAPWDSDLARPLGVHFVLLTIQ